MEFTEGVRFDSLHLSPEIIRAIEKRNIEVSTPVQAGCIPPMMDWQDVIAKAPTGTGKTFAYGIPIVEHVDPEEEPGTLLRHYLPGGHGHLLGVPAGRGGDYRPGG